MLTLNNAQDNFQGCPKRRGTTAYDMRCVWFARLRIADGIADGGIRNSEDREKTRKCYASHLSPDSDTVQYCT